MMSARGSKATEDGYEHLRTNGPTTTVGSQHHAAPIGTDLGRSRFFLRIKMFVYTPPPEPGRKYYRGGSTTCGRSCKEQRWRQSSRAWEQ